MPPSTISVLRASLCLSALLVGVACSPPGDDGGGASESQPITQTTTLYPSSDAWIDAAEGMNASGAVVNAGLYHSPRQAWVPLALLNGVLAASSPSPP